jgi:hypothetical protein
MNIQSVIDSNFDINITSSYFLSIRLSPDGFSFCVLDPVSNEYIQFYHRPVSLSEDIDTILEKELESNDLLIYPYQKILVMYHTNKFTLVPNALFNKEEEANYLKFCFNTNSLDQHLTFCNKIKMADATCIFAIPQKTVDILNKYYHHIHYFSQCTPFIETALLNTTNDTKLHHVHINIQPLHFDILVTSGNNLQMHNTFKYHDVKEFLYFVLFAFDQLKLDTLSTKIFLSGSITKSDEIFSLLKKYIKQVELCVETMHFKFSNVFKGIPLQNHINLLNIPLCV